MDVKFKTRKDLLSRRDKFDELKYFGKNNLILKRVEGLIEALCEEIKNTQGARKVRRRFCVDDGLGIYFPLKTEPDLFKLAITSDMCVCLPKVKNTDMQYVRYQAGGQLIKSDFGDLYVPSGNAVVIPKIALVPGVAFDLRGYRLGYGIGHFDRYFSQKNNSKIIKIGVCYDEMLLESLPHDVHDVKMDYIVTEINIYKICA